MRIIFSRKGFDTGSGGFPSPIIGGRPISLPIPTSGKSVTTYGDLGLGELVERTTRGRIGADHLCHEDPMFFSGQCLFGQCGIAQAHLKRNSVGPGDVFLFFGLFNDEGGRDRHHRIFGYMRVETMLEGAEIRADHPLLAVAPRHHPHTIGKRSANNCVYVGHGKSAANADPRLRLTREAGPLRRWNIPTWLHETGLTYHGKPERWLDSGQLDIVSRGQEFITCIGDREEPRRWLELIIGHVAA